MRRRIKKRTIKEAKRREWKETKEKKKTMKKNKLTEGNMRMKIR